jgi:hypothetical protein
VKALRQRPLIEDRRFAYHVPRADLIARRETLRRGNDPATRACDDPRHAGAVTAVRQSTRRIQQRCPAGDESRASRTPSDAEVRNMKPGDRVRLISPV